MFLGNEERDAAQILSDAMARDGIGIHLNTETVNVRTEGNQKIVDLASDDYKFTLNVDEILVGIGSAPNVEGMNLEAAGVDYDKEAGILTNDYLQTSNPQIYAAGDVCSEKKFPHIETAAADLVVRNAPVLGSRETERVGNSMVHLYGSRNRARRPLREGGPRERHPGQNLHRDDA